LTTFYAKQAQFPKSQMNVSIFSKMGYENKSDWTLGENKPNQRSFSGGHITFAPPPPHHGTLAANRNAEVARPGMPGLSQPRFLQLQSTDWPGLG
jgi:hypothetical protein